MTPAEAWARMLAARRRARSARAREWRAAHDAHVAAWRLWRGAVQTAEAQAGRERRSVAPGMVSDRPGDSKGGDGR